MEFTDGAWVVNEGVVQTYALRRSFWTPAVLCATAVVLAAGVVAAIVGCDAVRRNGSCGTDGDAFATVASKPRLRASPRDRSGTLYPLIVAWVPFALVGKASATVTAVERLDKAFVISSGCDQGWPLPIKEIVRVGVVAMPCRGPVRTFRIETALPDPCYGKKVYEFDLEDVDAFVRENFSPFTLAVAQPVA